VLHRLAGASVLLLQSPGHVRSVQCLSFRVRCVLDFAFGFFGCLFGLGLGHCAAGRCSRRMSVFSTRAMRSARLAIPTQPSMAALYASSMHASSMHIHPHPRTLSHTHTHMRIRPIVHGVFSATDFPVYECTLSVPLPPY
jgi:hypothetical protein